MNQQFNRRKFCISSAATISTALLGASCASQNSVSKLRGNIKQVIAAWPFMATGPKWSAEQLIKKAADFGVAGVELMPPEHWHLLKKYHMVCAASKSHTFVRGMNNKGHHAECLQTLTKVINETSDAGFPNVMTFTGMADTSKEKNGSVISAEEGMKNCIEGYKKIVGLAEKKNITLILEPLNSRATEHMKGHPGYQGDHIDYCMEIIKAVSSPSLKLLFDVYHIQIMDGNLISNLNKHFEYINHVQIAGNPGRGEIGPEQEINYKAVMNALKQNGYKHYVGHEWIPTKNAMNGLSEAISICDV
ncbi:MAG: TIM barrel protein [Lentisphaerales bacterium]|nr:TIM barrel protein [Lentisphaerales bacterium]